MFGWQDELASIPEDVKKQLEANGFTVHAGKASDDTYGTPAYYVIRDSKGNESGLLDLDNVSYFGLTPEAFSALPPEQQKNATDVVGSLRPIGTGSGSGWTDFRDAVEGTAANFTPVAGALFGEYASEGAQEYIDPGLQMVSSVAGLGAYAGASNPGAIGTADPWTAGGGGGTAAGTGASNLAVGGGLTAEAAASTAAMTPEAYTAATTAGFGTTGTAASVGLGTEALGAAGAAGAAEVAGVAGAAEAAQLLGFGTGLYGLFGPEPSGGGGGGGGGAPADPFAQYRDQAAQDLMALQADPSLLTQRPGYLAGLEAVQRSMGAQGYQGSGNMMAALSEYGGNEYDREMKRLMTMSGASTSPAAGAGVDAQNYQTTQSGNIADYQARIEALNRIAGTLYDYGTQGN